MLLLLWGRICGMLWDHNSIIVVVEFYLSALYCRHISRPIRIYCDNYIVVFFSKNDKYSKGVKHVKLKYLSMEEEINKQKVPFEHIGTDLMIDHLLTKGYSSRHLLVV